MSIVTDLISGAGSGILSSVSKVISNFKADPTQIAEIEKQLETLKVTHEETMSKLANDLETEYLKDTQNARDSNVKIQESEKASWLAKNVGYCIDIFLIVTFAAMLGIIIYKAVPAENKELFYTSFGMLGMYVGQCISFHRGTTKGSGDKQKLLEKMVNK